MVLQWLKGGNFDILEFRFWDLKYLDLLSLKILDLVVIVKKCILHLLVKIDGHMRFRDEMETSRDMMLVMWTGLACFLLK